uniref:Enoyl reductase (ER) domain-containing protein n=1 Tax=Araucaria cunninghamii TaxID=56994 RepID=A0A0D6QSZ8_ARACU
MAKGTAEHPQQALGWAARDSSGLLSPFNFNRRANGPDDVTIMILYCGICHTDLHQSRNDWGTTSYPIVPGHEITGVVTAVGSNVKNLKAGDRAGVGCMVGACHNCEHCEDGNENYCEKYIFTYNSVDSDGSITFGGYSNFIVVHQRYAVHIPEKLAMDAAAPLLCAGITVYSPMKFYGMTEPGKRLAVVGLGGLGHMAVKFGKAFGLHVTVISTSPEKEAEAKVRLGADDFLLSKDEKQMQKASRSFDYIIDTVAVQHPIFPLLNVLKVNGKMVLVGAPDKPLALPAFPLIFGRRMIAGSMIGGMKETQEMINFCAEHDITCDIEKIPMDYVNTAMERLKKSDVRYRFVLDVGNTLASNP